jgi:IPTL-CTERM motif
LKCSLLALAGLCVSPSLWATSYVFTGTSYTSTIGFVSPCATGSCANYTVGQSVNGQFTTATPLGANLVDQNIYARITSYSFTDGINTYSSSSPNVRFYNVTVSTDAAANITSFDVILQLWQTGLTPHSAGNRFSYFEVGTNIGQAVNNAPCTAVGTGLAGQPDTCIGTTQDSSTSFGFSPATGTWLTQQTPQQPIPTLSQRAMMLLSLLMLGVALRTRKRVSRTRI